MRTGIYTRVSTAEQVLEGFSLDAQLHRLRAYCESQGWEIADVYTDEGISAKDTVRPELQRMFSDIESGKLDVVLVYKLDRLTRSVHDLYDMLNLFDKHNVGFKSSTEVFDTTTAMGRLFITIVGALAQWERETIGERSRFGQAQMVREGRYFGHTAPYGYELCDGALHIHPSESPVVRMIFELYLGGNGTSRIVKHLNDSKNSIPRPRGSETWSMKVVMGIVKNEAYAGYVRYGNKTKGKPGKEFVLAKSDHEPIVSEEDFNRAQQLVKTRRTAPPRSGTGIHPLVGVLRCGLCGGAMVGRTERAGQGGRVNPYYGYICNTRRHARTCAMKMWKREKIEGSVIQEIERMSAGILKAAQDEPVQTDNSRDIKRIENALQRLSAQRKKWTDAFNKDHITSENLGEQFRTITAEENALKDQLQHLSAQPSKASVDHLRNFSQHWEAGTPQERKELIRDVAETIWVYSDGEVKVQLCV